jgi:hypothetical protein
LEDHISYLTALPQAYSSLNLSLEFSPGCTNLNYDACVLLISATWTQMICERFKVRFDPFGSQNGVIVQLPGSGSKLEFKISRLCL